MYNPKEILLSYGIHVTSITSAEADNLIKTMLDAVRESAEIGETPVQRDWYVTQIDKSLKSDNTLELLAMYVNGSYFEERQILFIRPSTNTVELAGWADSKNSKPIDLAFHSWCMQTVIDRS